MNLKYRSWNGPREALSGTDWCGIRADHQSFSEQRTGSVLLWPGASTVPRLATLPVHQPGPAPPPTGPGALGRLSPTLPVSPSNVFTPFPPEQGAHQPVARVLHGPGMAMNAAQHRIVSLLKMSRGFCVITCHNVFNMWPRDAERPDTLP